MMAKIPQKKRDLNIVEKYESVTKIVNLKNMLDQIKKFKYNENHVVFYRKLY